MGHNWGLLLQFAILPVYGQLCALWTNELANSLQSKVEMQAHISGQTEKHTYF